MKQPIKFNGIEIPEFVKVVGRTSSVLPPIDVRSTQVSKMMGEVFTRVQIKPKEEQLDIVIVIPEGSNLDNLKDELAVWLVGDGLKPSKLSFKEQPDKYILAVVDGSTDIDDLFFVGKGSINFIATNPVKYSDREMIATGNNQITVNYKGTVEQRPVIEFEVTSPCKVIEIYSDKSSSKIKLTSNFVTGNKLIVDSNKKLIKLNNKVEMKILALESDWLSVISGTNKFTISVDGKISNTVVSNSKLTVKEAYY